MVRLKEQETFAFEKRVSYRPRELRVPYPRRATQACPGVF